METANFKLKWVFLDTYMFKDNYKAIVNISLVHTMNRTRYNLLLFQIKCLQGSVLLARAIPCV